MRKPFLFFILIVGFLFVYASGYCDENRFTFHNPTAGSTFADTFSDSGEASWYQLWTGDLTGSIGNFVDTSAFNEFGNGWIHIDHLSQLYIDFAQADSAALWVRPWDSVNKTGRWGYGSVDFSSATQGKVTRTLSGSLPMDQLFIDSNIADNAWYQIWFGNGDGTGGYLDTSSLNAYGKGWVLADNLDQLSFEVPEGETSQEMWVKVYSGGRNYGWENWTVAKASAPVFSMVDYFPLSGSWETDKRTLFTSVKRRDINGITTHEIADTLFGATFFLTNDDNGLRFHGAYESGVSDNEDAALEIFDTPIVFATASVSVGDKTTSTFTYAGMPVNISVELMAVEDVTVPAGTFSQCLKFKATEWVTGQSEGDNGYETIWLAKNIGFVKAMNDTDSLIEILSNAGNTRQLLRYWVPSELDADQQAIYALMTEYVDAKEGGDLTGLMAIYSENFYQSCRNKASRQSQESDRFDGSIYNKYCAGIEEIQINNDQATAMIEFYVHGTNKSSGSNWQYAGRQSSHFIKENGTWYSYGSQMDINPFDSAWWAVSSRNQESGSFGAISASFQDCSTGGTMDSLESVASFTITGPPGSGLDNDDLTSSWDDGGNEFWNSSLINYATMPSGFYTFRLEDTLGNMFSFSDYFERMPLLDIPVPTTLFEGGQIPPEETTLSWNAVTGTDYYRIDLEKNVNGAWQRQTFNAQETSYTLTLDPVSSYRWRLRARTKDRLNGDDYLENESSNSWDYFSTSAD